MKFRGQRNPPPDLRVYVFVAKEGVEKPLSPELSQRVVNHSDQFEWGFGRVGGRQLALALLLEVTQDVDLVLSCYHDFERSIIALLPKKSWTLTEEKIRQWIGQWKKASELLGHSVIMTG